MTPSPRKRRGEPPPRQEYQRNYYQRKKQKQQESREKANQRKRRSEAIKRINADELLHTQREDQLVSNLIDGMRGTLRYTFLGLSKQQQTTLQQQQAALSDNLENQWKDQKEVLLQHFAGQRIRRTQRNSLPGSLE